MDYDEDDDELSCESDQYEDANEYNDNDPARHSSGSSPTMPQAEPTTKVKLYIGPGQGYRNVKNNKNSL